MTLSELDPVPPWTERECRSPDDYLPMQAVTRQIAFDEGGGWDEERRAKIAGLFAGLAPGWHTKSTEERLAATRDALDRSGASGDLALEIGSGTGIHTPLVCERFATVVALDLVREMLALSPRAAQVSLVQADAASLPIADGAVDAIVCVNAFVFPREFARVLKPSGRIVVVATSGEHTPIHLPPHEVVAALEPVLGPVEATTARCGWSIWTSVARARRGAQDEGGSEI